MHISQVAAQLFTVRNHIKTPEDIAATLKKVREIGYQAVQVSAMGPIAEDGLRSMLDNEGLSCCVTHEKTPAILDTPEQIVERLKKLDCKYTAIPSPMGIDIGNIDAVRDFVSKINKAGKVFHDAGMTLTYHNHALEFLRIGNKPVLEILYDETDPRYLQGELDTYWVQAGGGSPVEWCRKLDNRLPLLHMKDYGIKEGNNAVFKEIGSGNLNWPAIVSTAEEAGCKWFIVEQDGEWLHDDPFESLKVSFEFIKNNLCE